MLERALMDLSGRIGAVERELERRVIEVPHVPAPAARAVASGTVVGSGGAGTILMTSASYDTDAMYDGTNKRLKATRAGKYVVSSTCKYPGAAGGTLRWSRLIFNGVTVLTEATTTEPAGTFGTSGVYHSLSAAYSFAAGDYLVMDAYQDTGGNLTVTGDCTMEWVGN